MPKLNNQYCVNVDNNLNRVIIKLADYYQRKPSEMIRLLLTPVIMDQFAKIQLATKQATSEIKPAIFHN